jgi:cytochrome b561
MKLLNTSAEYGVVSRTLHWIVVLALVGQWLLAEAGEDAEAVGGSSFDALTLHHSFGLTILMLAAIRLVWRLFNPKPEWPSDMKPYEIVMARVVHIGFYVLLFAIPLSGWALASVEDEPLRYFAFFDVPRIAASGKETLEEVHEVLFNVLVGLALLHVAGAAKHWLARRALKSSYRS